MNSSLEQAALHAVAHSAGLRADDARHLHHHANAVYLLPAEQLVARVKRGDVAAANAERAVAVTRWLQEQDFSAPRPADVPQPVRHDDYVVTFWHYYPQPETAPAAHHLGELLRVLHGLPSPPVELPLYAPLTSLERTVAASTFLENADRAWLLGERQALVDAYHQLDFPLGHGHIHGDAYPGNLLWNGPRVMLGDWDEVAWGPRELDLANTYQGARFGRSAGELAAFRDAYGYDLTTWDGFPVLRRLRDLHTLGAYIRRADRGDGHAAEQLTHRLDSLRAGDGEAVWAAR